MDPNGPGWTSLACAWVQLKFWDGPGLGPVQWCGCPSRFPLENRVKIVIFLDYFASSLHEYLHNTVQTQHTQTHAGDIKDDLPVGLDLWGD